MVSNIGPDPGASYTLSGRLAEFASVIDSGTISARKSKHFAQEGGIFGRAGNKGCMSYVNDVLKISFENLIKRGKSVCVSGTLHACTPEGHGVMSFAETDSLTSLHNHIGIILVECLTGKVMGGIAVHNGILVAMIDF